MKERGSRLLSLFGMVLLSGAFLASCGSGDRPESDAETGPLRITGGGTSQSRQHGRIESNREYGHEARRSELVQAAHDVHGYLVARVTEDWAMACTYLGKHFREQLEQEASRSQGVAGKGCGAMVDAYTATIQRRQRYELSEVTADSLRVKGDTGYLFFNRASGGQKFLMTREGSEWRIAANLAPTPAS